MFEKLSKPFKYVAQFTVSAVKAFAMTVNLLNLFKALTDISTDKIPEELGKGNIKAGALVVGGIITFSSIMYIKYLQMIPPAEMHRISAEERTIQIVDEESTLINSSINN